MVIAVLSVLLGALSPDTVRPNTGKDDPVQQITLTTIDGEPTTLKDHEGKVVLLVNVASECGYTPQYEGLETLYNEKKDEGLVVLGVPCNDFGNQEPGSADEIKSFCATNFGVSFPMLEKAAILGDEAHPLYAHLRSLDKPIGGPVRWNFTKFVIDRSGAVVARFEPDAGPDSPLLRRTIDDALAGR